MITETVFLRRDNPNLATFLLNGEEIDFTPVTRFICHFAGSDVFVDTAIHPGLIRATTERGQLRFWFRDLVIDQGLYGASIIVFDHDHPNGQVLVCQSDDKLKFRFVDNCN